MAAPGRLHDKVAIVTGGGSGLGEGIVRKFVNEGAKVLIFEIDENNARRVADGLPSESTMVFRGDVTREDDWVHAVKECTSKLNGLDIVVNNAGVVHRNGVSQATPSRDFFG